MVSSFNAIASLLSCPEDGESLCCVHGELLCPRCARRFPIHGENLVEILPGRPYQLPASVSPAYREAYIRAFEQPYSHDDTALAWGAEENVPESWALKRRRQVAMVRQLISEGVTPDDSVLCDISAGAGYCTLALAPLFRFVIHCDLSVDNLNYVSRKACALDIQNIFFLRADYFAPPFRHSLDRIICLDTLIRGGGHDSVLLRAIVRSLKPGGHAVVDFHNWWHNPLRRLGVLRDNFLDNKSYTRGELRQLLASTGIHQFEIKPFVQEVGPGQPAGKFFLGLIPPTRFMVRLPAWSEPSTRALTAPTRNKATNPDDNHPVVESCERPLSQRVRRVTL
jgi:SAM-dependent methyltransferase